MLLPMLKPVLHVLMMVYCVMLSMSVHFYMHYSWASRGRTGVDPSPPQRVSSFFRVGFAVSAAIPLLVDRRRIVLALYHTRSATPHKTRTFP